MPKCQNKTRKVTKRYYFNEFTWFENSHLDNVNAQELNCN